MCCGHSCVYIYCIIIVGIPILLFGILLSMFYCITCVMFAFIPNGLLLLEPLHMLAPFKRPQSGVRLTPCPLNTCTLYNVCSILCCLYIVTIECIVCSKWLVMPLLTIPCMCDMFYSVPGALKVLLGVSMFPAVWTFGLGQFHFSDHHKHPTDAGDNEDEVCLFDRDEYKPKSSNKQSTAPKHR